MKRIMGVLFIVIICLVLVACEDRQSSEQPTETIVDVNDLDALYNFVSSNIYDVSREEFNLYVEIKYLDVTNDGYKEAVICNYKDWSTNIAVITLEKNEFKYISTDLRVAKYDNKFAAKDGFLAVTQTTGGTGIQEEYLSLAVYSNGQMITVLEGLETALTLSQSNINYEDIAELNGDFTSFEYILRRIEGNKVTKIRQAFYTYSEDTLSFEIKEVDILNEGSDISEPESSKSSYAAETHRDVEIDYDEYDFVIIDSYGGSSLNSLEYYEFDRPGSDRQLAYARDVAIVGEIYNLYYHSSDTNKDYRIADKLANKILILRDYAEVSPASFIYFEDISGYKYAVDVIEDNGQFETIMVKGDNRQVYGLEPDISEPKEGTEPDEDYDEGYEHERITGFIGEIINGEYIEYGDYISVVIEEYYGTHSATLNKAEFKNPKYEEYTTTYNIAVFGTITEIMLKSIQMGEEDQGPFQVTADLSNSILTIHSSFPTDTSTDIISFYDHDDVYHEIVVENMSGERSIFKKVRND